MTSHHQSQRVGVISISVLFTLLLSSTMPAEAVASPHRVLENLVLRSETAIAIAKAVAEETYGAESIATQLPLVAARKGDAWHVSGHLPAGIPGGVVEVWIAARDGRVIRLTHGK